MTVAEPRTPPSHGDRTYPPRTVRTATWPRRTGLPRLRILSARAGTLAAPW
ncbi:hypothetical protein [Streptomyces misionensis]|uniref:hypothetical protein n=1 Tax=Streptomyces misionensis TaxID=67331 RepID=UPI0037029661